MKLQMKSMCVLPVVLLWWVASTLAFSVQEKAAGTDEEIQAKLDALDGKGV